MSNAPVPAEVQQFILECIDSVAQLEALLLLRDNPERSWTARDVAQRLYIGEADVAPLLQHLVACKLAATDGALFRYFVEDDARRDLVERVALAYKRYLVPVTQLIHGKSLNIRKFADAFRVRKDK
jgi:hypothetical protein